MSDIKRSLGLHIITPTRQSLIVHTSIIYSCGPVVSTSVAQLTKNVSPIGCRPVYLSPTCLSPDGLSTRWLVTEKSIALRFKVHARSNKAINNIANLARGYARSSADADNRRDAFSVQSRSTNMVPFWVRCDFSLSMWLHASPPRRCKQRYGHAQQSAVRPSAKRRSKIATAFLNFSTS